MVAFGNLLKLSLILSLIGVILLSFHLYSLAPLFKVWLSYRDVFVNSAVGCPKWPSLIFGKAFGSQWLAFIFTRVFVWQNGNIKIVTGSSLIIFWGMFLSLRVLHGLLVHFGKMWVVQVSKGFTCFLYLIDHLVFNV